MGALVGVEEYRVPLKRFGHNLGMAFQVADDILDYVGSEEVTGKPVGQDLKERKVTLPLLGARKVASAAAEAEIQALFNGGGPASNEITRVVDLVRDLGGVDYAKRKAQVFAEGAEEALEGLPEGTAVDALRDCITYVVDRNR
jgi:geranylgeranyl pyrophosphate synthase